jgi:thioredoxin reductase (NADPH)
VVGAGPAGYTSAIYAARAGIKVKLLGGPMIGGQLTMTKEIENYPGFRDRSAHKLVEIMKQQCIELGVEIVHNSAINLGVDPLSITDCKNNTLSPDAIIIATGAAPKALGVPNESRLMNAGAGVSTCAVCDGSCFRGLEVAVIGGGNTAVEDAIYLSKIASKVHLIHRRDTLRAEYMLQQKLMQLPNVEFHWNCQVKEFVGKDLLTHLLLSTPGGDTTLKVDGAFVAIGHIPNTSWCADVLPLDENGYVKTKLSGNLPGILTEIPGVFVAGDATDHIYRQAITAAGQGCMAALEAAKYLG